jgi:hypothetical protein
VNSEAVTVALRELELWGTRSTTKFIPPEYLLNSSQVRIALLQGLFKHFLLGGCEKAVGRLFFKVGDGFLNLNNFTGGCLDFLVSSM